MAKLNCWEYKKCGREPGGINFKTLGVCPAATEIRVNGLNGGKNGGRACWALTGTLCEGKIQGTFAAKLGSCIKCDFFKLVVREENINFKNSKEIIERLK